MLDACLQVSLVDQHVIADDLPLNLPILLAALLCKSPSMLNLVCFEGAPNGFACRTDPCCKT